ncbi:MAG: arsenate reductase ArsC, partial [Planctomycetota bacterium]
MHEEVKKILFVCTGNACRSQIAEGWGRNLLAPLFEVYSAGSTCHGIDPLAAKVMLEEGIDISSQSSKKVTDIIHKKYDFVISLCPSAEKHLPVFPPDTVVISREFDDPPHMAFSSGDGKNVLFHYRRVRDEIRQFVADLPNFLAQ